MTSFRINKLVFFIVRSNKVLVFGYLLISQILNEIITLLLCVSINTNSVKINDNPIKL